MIQVFPDGLTPLDTNAGVPDIASSAVSLDGSMLAVSTPDYLVMIWLLSRKGPYTPVSYKGLLRSGGERHLLTPRAPITFTCDDDVAYGTCDKAIIILGHGGQRLQTLTCAAHVKAIVAHGDMLYASLNNGYGVVTTVAYSNKKSQQNEFDDSRTKSATSMSEQVPTFYRLDEVFEAPSYSRRQAQWYIIFPAITFFMMWLVRGRSMEGHA
ncbi:hypothetical protein FRC12_015869 [Ceratobasidium sp. 428]|nr:hypothetical protein FRC12_015869 [Ceratobasidium sp. 428]